MVKLSEGGKLLRDTCYITPLAGGGIVEIIGDDTVIARREGEKELKKVEGE